MAEPLDLTKVPQEMLQNMPGEAGYTRSFDPDENKTRVWDKDNNIIKYEQGNTEKLGSTYGQAHLLAGPPDPKVARGADGSIDKVETGKNILDSLVPALAQFAPELKIFSGIKAMSPIQAVLSKMGLSTLVGTGMDQAIHSLDTQPRGLLDSAANAGVNAGVGVGLPELFNMRPSLGPQMSQSTTTTSPTVAETLSNIVANSTGKRSGTTTGERSGSTTGTSATQSEGSGQTNNQSTTISGVPNSETRKIQGRDTKGRWLPAEETQVQIPGFKSDTTAAGSNEQSSHSSNTSQNDMQSMLKSINEQLMNMQSQSQRTGQSTTTTGPTTSTTVGPKSGWLSNLVNTLQSIQSQKYNGRLGPGQGNLTPLQTALLGLGFNLPGDVQKSK